MQKFNDHIRQNLPARRAFRPLLVFLGLCFSQFTAAQSSDINASATFNVPISISCTSNLSFGTISIISTGEGTADGTNSLYNTNNKIELIPYNTAADGALINNGNVNVSGASFGSCEITGVADGSTLKLSFDEGFVSLSSADTSEVLSVTPITVSESGSKRGGVQVNTITIDESAGAPNYGLNASAVTSDAYSYDPGSNTFTFQVGGEMNFSGKSTVPLADLVGAYTGSIAVQVEL